ncbi:unnamed protein product [Caenorhabditis nigoni]
MQMKMVQTESSEDEDHEDRMFTDLMNEERDMIDELRIRARQIAANPPHQLHPMSPHLLHHTPPQQPHPITPRHPMQTEFRPMTPQLQLMPTQQLHTTPTQHPMAPQFQLMPTQQLQPMAPRHPMTPQLQLMQHTPPQHLMAPLQPPHVPMEFIQAAMEQQKIMATYLNFLLQHQ